MKQRNHLSIIAICLLLCAQPLLAGGDHTSRNIAPYLVRTGFMGAFANVCSHYYAPFMSYLTDDYAKEDYDDSDVAKTSGASEEENLAYIDPLSIEYIEEHIQDEQTKKAFIEALKCCQEIEAALYGTQEDCDDSDVAKTSGASEEENDEGPRDYDPSERAHPFYDSWSEEDYLALTHKWSKKDIQEEEPQQLFIKSARAAYTEVLTAFLCDERIDVNGTDERGKTALMYAVYRKKQKPLHALLQHQEIDVNVLDNHKQTALMLAASRHLFSSMDTLLKHKDIGKDRLLEHLSINPLTLNAEKYSALKNLHAFFQMETYGYEGSMKRFLFPQVAQHFRHLTTHTFKGDFWKGEEEALRQYFAPLLKTMLNANADSIHADITAGTPTWIPAAYPGHLISISINGDWISIANRGDCIDYSKKAQYLNTSGSYFLKNPNIKEILTREFIEKLLKSEDKDALKELRQMSFESGLRAPKKLQKRGNCGYACSKFFVRDHLIFFMTQQKKLFLGQKGKDRSSAGKKTLRLYRDFTILERILVFNDYIDQHFDPKNPGERELITVMYQAIKKLISKGPTGESGFFQVIDVRDSEGNEIPILDQLSPEGRYIAEQVLIEKLSWPEYLLYLCHTINQGLLSTSG